jgi:hypothetical protein
MADTKDGREALREASSTAASALDADILYFNGSLDGGIDNEFIKLVCARRRRGNVALIITTEGGNADCAFRIARCLQASYKNFTAVVPGYCKSAGTLVCTGASELVIGDMGELGPLDVQLAKPDELGLQSSGLTIDSSFRSLQAAAFQMFEGFLLDTLGKSAGRITTKTAAELSVSLTVGLFSPIFEQMEPLKIGEDYRSTRIAEEYAMRLSGISQNLKDPQETIEALVRGYPSHGFVIDRTEASALFRRVSELGSSLLTVVNALGPSAVIPRSVYRSQPPIVRFLNEEVKDEQRTESAEASGAQSPGRAKSAAAGAGPDRPLPSDSAKGNGNVAVPITPRSPRTRGETQADG